MEKKEACCLKGVNCKIISNLLKILMSENERTYTFELCATTHKTKVNSKQITKITFEYKKATKLSKLTQL